MPQPPLNTYGDVIVPTTGRHGSDIASQRADDLDRGCLEYVQKQLNVKKTLQVVDIGGGLGAQSMRMAKAGADVLMIDLSDRVEAIAAFNATCGREAIRFLRKDVREIKDWPQGLGCVYSQRMINYLPYEDALSLLTMLRSYALSGAFFFFSSGGIDTEYGKEYPDRDKPMEERFAFLTPTMGAKHSITSKVCLYREAELCFLAEKAGLTVHHAWTSPFGNPKVVAYKKVG